MKFPKLDAAIAAYQRERGITQADLAKEMGMAQNTFSWKRRGVGNSEFSLSEAARLADLMGASIDELVGREVA